VAGAIGLAVLTKQFLRSIGGWPLTLNVGVTVVQELANDLPYGAGCSVMLCLHGGRKLVLINQAKMLNQSQTFSYLLSGAGFRKFAIAMSCRCKAVCVTPC
jgi:hypothetical protein